MHFDVYPLFIQNIRRPNEACVNAIFAVVLPLQAKMSAILSKIKVILLKNFEKFDIIKSIMQ